jgi:hypothetical protein
MIMAKAAVQVKAKKKNKLTFDLPKGYKSITGGSSWKPDKPGDFIEGKYKGAKVLEMPKRGRIPARDVNLHSITQKDGTAIDIFQSGGLKALESLKKGQQVFIQYVGKKVITKGQQPMREFIVGTK